MTTHKHDYFSRAGHQVFTNTLCGKSIRLPLEHADDPDYGDKVIGKEVLWFDDGDVTCDDCMAQYALSLLADLP